MAVKVVRGTPRNPDKPEGRLPMIMPMSMTGLACLPPKGIPTAISAAKTTNINRAMSIPIMAKAFDIEERPRAAFAVALL